MQDALVAQLAELPVLTRKDAGSIPAGCMNDGEGEAPAEPHCSKDAARLDPRPPDDSERFDMRRVISLFRQPEEYLALLDYEDDPAQPASEADFNQEPEYFR